MGNESSSPPPCDPFLSIVAGPERNTRKYVRENYPGAYETSTVDFAAYTNETVVHVSLYAGTFDAPTLADFVREERLLVGGRLVQPRTLVVSVPNPPNWDYVDEFRRVMRFLSLTA